MPAPITPEDLYRFRWIDHARLSPDGERVAYQVGWADANARQNRSRIVVRRLLDPEPVEPTAGVQRDHSPEWSPDGRSLAFVSRVGAADQLFVLDLTTSGPAQQLSAIPDGIGVPRWSPDGKRIAFLGAVLADADAVVDDPRPPESREQLRRAPVARVVRRLDYKHDGRGYVDGRQHHLFSVAAAGGEVKQLTDGPWDVSDFDWAPDGSRLVVAGNAELGADLQRELNLYLVDLDANLVRLGGGFYLSSPIWSPKGDLIAFIAPNGLDAGLLERLWVVPLAGGGPRCLTPNFDQAVNDSVINDMRAGHATRVTWSAEGDCIYEPVDARPLRGPARAGVLHRAGRVEARRLGAQAARLRPEPPPPDRAGDSRRPARPVRLVVLPRAADPGRDGLRRLLHEPTRFLRIRRALPPRRRAGLGGPRLPRHLVVARSDDRARRLHRCEPARRRWRLLRRLHDQLDHRPDQPFLGCGLDALDLQPRQRVLAARHRAVGGPAAWPATLAEPGRAVAPFAAPLRAEHEDAALTARRRDGSPVRDVAVGGAVRRNAAARQDCRAGAVPGGVARPVAQRPS